MKSTNPERQERLRTISMLCMLALAAMMLLWIHSAISSPNMSLNNEPVYRIPDAWQITCNGQTYQDSLPTQLPAKAGDTIRCTFTLQKTDILCNSALFYSYHQFVNVYLDNELIHTYGSNLDMPFHMPPTSGWQFIRLPDDWAGRTLCIELTGIYDSYSGKIDAVWLGTKNAFSFMILERALPNLIICLPILIFGFVLLFASMLTKIKLPARRMFSLGLFSIVASCWILCESQISQLVFNKPIGSTLGFLCFALVPILILRFILTYEDLQNSLFLKVLYVLSLINFVGIQVLQITGTLHYIQSILGTQVLLLLTIAMLLYTYLHKKLHHLPITDSSIFYAGFTFAAFSLIDLLRLYLAPSITSAVVNTQLGLAFFIVILACTSFLSASRERSRIIEKKALEKLAYTDILTGLKNRTSYEQAMEQYRHKATASKPVFLIADINSLKQINDIRGHSCGDKAIMFTGRCLEEVFSKYGICYRIGGDEFCVIAERISDEALTGCIKKFQLLLQNASREVGFSFDVAIGYQRTVLQSIEQSMIQADHSMYQEKAKMKNAQKKKL